MYPIFVILFSGVSDLQGVFPLTLLAIVTTVLRYCAACDVNVYCRWLYWTLTTNRWLIDSRNLGCWMCTVGDCTGHWHYVCDWHRWTVATVSAVHSQTGLWCCHKSPRQSSHWGRAVTESCQEKISATTVKVNERHIESDDWTSVVRSYR